MEMKKIPNIKTFNEWYEYYESESLHNTDLSYWDNLNPRRPDAYVDLTSNIFHTPPYYLNDPDEIGIDWYD